MTSPAPAVTVGGLLKTRPEAFGLDLELLAGSGGLDRRITNPIDESEIDDAPETGEEP
jgi:hypothetical protein